MVGKRLSHFRIVEELGRGANGIVYRARDERLERDVALKVLPSGALADAPTRRSFRQEARALSKLNHAHIETVHDFDNQEGVDFLVLELIAGETLQAVLQRGALPERDVIRLGEQLAEGLSAAHAEGVLHRDIKPGNLRLTAAGQLKILDFGLAQLTRPEGTTTETLAASGSVAGTVPYMAPEQLRGEKLDARNDVYAAGAVLYEMACGKRAFAQPTPAHTIQAILNELPQTPRQVNPKVSSELERIVLKCLEKEPQDRYQSARELAVDLRRLRSAATARPSPPGPRQRFRWRHLAAGSVLAGTAAAAVIVALIAFWPHLRERLRTPGGGIPGLAVLPLANLSGDPAQEYFADGMTDELITRLAQVRSLRVISLSSVMQYKRTQEPVPAIGKELHVGVVVQGSVLRVGDEVRISTQMLDVSTGQVRWAESFQRSVTNVLALQGEVAQAIVDKVRARLTPNERGRLVKSRRMDPEAHELYLRGRSALNQGSAEGFRSALELFRRATQIDPEYAEAYADLAITYAYASALLSAAEAIPRARAAATRALELDSELAAGHANLAYAEQMDWNWRAAEAGYRRALELNPGEAMVHANYGTLLVSLRRFDPAIQEFERARQIDPLSPLLAMMALWPLFEGRRYDEAITKARTLVAADPGNIKAHLILGQALLFSGDRERGVTEIARAAELDAADPFQLGWLGYAYGVAGERGKAQEVLQSLDRMQKEGAYVQPYLYALAHVGLGENDTALDWLEKAAAVRSDELGLLNVDPSMDPLRSSPRFTAIVERMGFLP